jgi:hypothetical protein
MAKAESAHTIIASDLSSPAHERVQLFHTPVPVRIALNEHTDARGELVFRQACAGAWRYSYRSG